MQKEASNPRAVAFLEPDQVEAPAITRYDHQGEPKEAANLCP